MRKFSCVLYLLLAGLPLLAQFKKGDRITGASVGSVYYNSGKTDYSYPGTSTQGYSNKSSNFGLRIEPGLGWFITEHTALGLSLNILPSSLKSTYESNGTTFRKDNVSSFNLGIGGFARNYFKDGGNLLPYGQFGVNFGINSQSSDGFSYVGSGASGYKDTYESSSSGGFYANTALQFGFTRLLNAHTGLDFYAGYSYSYNKATTKTTTKRDLGNNGSVDETFLNEPTLKTSNHGFILGVGFQIFLEKRK